MLLAGSRPHTQHINRLFLEPPTYYWEDYNFS